MSVGFEVERNPSKDAKWPGNTEKCASIFHWQALYGGSVSVLARGVLFCDTVELLMVQPSWFTLFCDTVELLVVQPSWFTLYQ